MRIFKGSLSQLVIPLLAVLLIVTLPITLPIAAAANARSRRRLLADAWAANRVVCGSPLGKAAIDRADDVWGAKMSKLREEDLYSMLRIVRRLYAICPEHFPINRKMLWPIFWRATLSDQAESAIQPDRMLL